MRAFFSFIMIACLFAVNANAQTLPLYEKYKRHPYADQQYTTTPYQAPTYHYQPYQYRSYQYQQQPTYQYQAPTYDYGNGLYNRLSAAQNKIADMHYQRDCMYGTYGCNKGPSEATQRYWQNQYLEDQINAQAMEDYRERKRREFYERQARLVKFMEWDPYK